MVDPPAILRIVSEGGGMRVFKSHVDKVNLALPSTVPAASAPTVSA